MWPRIPGTSFMASCNRTIRSIGTVWGALRAILLGASIVLGVAFSCLSSAQARLAESMQDFSALFSQLTKATSRSKESRLDVNGLELHRITASTRLSVKDTLDRLEGLCRDRGGLEGIERLLKNSGAASSSAWPSIIHGVYRNQGANQGTIACIDTGGPLGVTDLTRRLQEFARTKNLAALGKLRYALARRNGPRTSVLVFWTDGDARLLEMFPKSGDAPGTDLPGVPRPEQSVRLLSAAERGSPYSITAYRSTHQSPAAMTDWYQRMLKGRHFRVAQTQNGLAAVRGGRALLIRVSALAPGQTVAGVVELSRGDGK